MSIFKKKRLVMLIKFVNAHTPLPKNQNIINLDLDNLSQTISVFFTILPIPYR